MSVPPEATDIHGITNEELAYVPAWSQVAAVADLIQGRVLIAHNALFDERMLKQYCKRHELTVPAVQMWGCTLDLLIDFNDGRWPAPPSRSL